MEIIISHQGADFDAVASMVAVKKLYPGAILIRVGEPESQVRDFLRLHRGLFAVERAQQIKLEDVRRVIVVDTRTPSRLGPFRNLLQDRNVEVHVYDHHAPTQEGVQGDLDVMEPLGAAVTVVLKRVLERKLEITPPEATLFLAAIYSETGCLTYGSTTAEDLRMAAHLLEAGGNLQVATQFLRRPLTQEQSHLLDLLVSSAEYHGLGGHRLFLAQAELPHYVEDLGSIASRIRDLEEVDAVVVVVTMGPRTYLVGRSREASVDIGTLMRELGGGGHACAASAALPAQPTAPLLAQILQILERRWSPEATAADLMTTQVATIALEEELDVTSAQERLREIGHTATVLTAGGKPAGMLARSDLDKAIQHKLGHLPAQRFMSAPLLSVARDTLLSEIQGILIQRDIGRVPVVEHGELLGIVSRTDVLRSLYNSPSVLTRTVGPSLAPALLQISPRWLELLRRIGELAQQEGVEAYAVGGFVRDLLLLRPGQGKPFAKGPDLDIVVEGDGLEFSRKLAASFSARLRQHEAFQTSTLTFPDGFSLDVARARKELYCRPAALPTVTGSTLKQDLFRRDFSINAMACRLTLEHFGVLVDYFGGQADLESGAIRVLHNHSFIDDPTRIFRAVRFEQRLHFHIEQTTLQQLRQAMLQGVLHKITGQRIRDELILCLMEERATDNLRRLHKLKILHSIHPQLGLDVKTEAALSCLPEVLEWLHSVELTLEPWRAYLRVWLHRRTRQEVNEIQGLLRFPAEAMKPLNLPGSTEEEVQVAPRILWELAKPGPPSRIHELLSPCSPEHIAVLVTVAAQNKVSRERVADSVRLFLTQLRHQRPLLTGRDLQEAGLQPSPSFKNILQRAWATQLDQRWESAEQAREWLKSMTC